MQIPPKIGRETVLRLLWRGSEGISRASLCSAHGRMHEVASTGYYRHDDCTQDEQEPIPWAKTTCKDCPFWQNNICQLHAEYRSSTRHTRSYFDEAHWEDAKAIISQREEQGVMHWWQWFNDQGSSKDRGPSGEPPTLA